MRAKAFTDDKLRDLLAEGLSQKAAAERLGVTPAAVCKRLAEINAEPPQDPQDGRLAESVGDAPPDDEIGEQAATGSDDEPEAAEPVTPEQDTATEPGEDPPEATTEDQADRDTPPGPPEDHPTPPPAEPIDLARRELKAAADRQGRVLWAKAKVEASMADGRAEIERIRSEAPALFAARALGEATEGEVESLNHRMNEANRTLEEGELALRGLEPLEADAKAAVSRAQRVVERQEQIELYYRIKARLRKQYTDADMHELRKAAANIDRHGGIWHDFAAFEQELRADPRNRDAFINRQ